MNYLNIIPYDIYIQIYKFVYDDCMKEIIISYNDKRNNKYKDMFIQNILNDDNLIYYTSLEIFNPVSLGIINSFENCNKYYDNVDLLDEELYYLSAITEFNFRRYHFNILITELPDNLKDATCIRIKLSNIDILLGIDDPNNTNDIIYTPLYYLLNNFITTWLELIYYTNKLLNEYLLIHNIIMNVNFFPLYRFETIKENGYIVIVPFFEEYI